MARLAAPRRTSRRRTPPAIAATASMPDRQSAAATRRSSGVSSALASRLPAIKKRDRRREHNEQDDRAEDAELGRVALVGRTGGRRQRRDRMAATASTSSVDIVRCRAAEKRWTRGGARRAKKARPSTSRLFARIEPTSAVWTTTTRPGLEGEQADEQLRAGCRAPTGARRSCPAPRRMAELRRSPDPTTLASDASATADTTKTRHVGRARRAEDDGQQPWSRRPPR